MIFIGLAEGTGQEMAIMIIMRTITMMMMMAITIMMMMMMMIYCLAERNRLEPVRIECCQG